MKQLQLVACMAIAALVAGCETTSETAGTGNQEQKRLARIQQEQQQASQYDESEINLWNAHQDRLDTGTNPVVPYAVAARH